MNQSRRAWSRWLALALAAGTLPAACYDTPLIPDPGLISVAGRGGKPAEIEDTAGAPDHPAGSPSSGGSAGSSAGAGGTSPAGKGGTAGKAGTAGSTSGEAGHASGGTPPRVTWLDLTGNRASSTSATNRDLGIEGSFDVYSDSCASLSWDPATRCAIGRTCNPRVVDDVWGIAIGFHFDDTGADGSPPNTKRRWDPRDVGALGVTWRAHGMAPSLQLWVLNMAPSWNGQCNGMTCEISGPPDGDDAIALEGELLFSGMEKDDWGGSGEAYSFDPAAVFALQFKLPAIRIGAANFDFCIDALGIIR